MRMRGIYHERDFFVKAWRNSLKAFQLIVISLNKDIFGSSIHISEEEADRFTGRTYEE